MMKWMTRNMIVLVGAAALWAGLTACGPVQSQPDAQSGSTPKQQTVEVDANASASIKGSREELPAVQANDSNVAVVYFSDPETENQNDVEGSTQYLANVIHQRTGADVYRIEPQKAYAVNHKILVADAKAELLRNARPELKDTIGDLSQYDTIFLGYPIWWGTMPKIINTFLESYDLSNKTIMPFCTSGGSGISSSVSAIKSICTNSTVKDGLRGSSSTESDRIRDWFKTIGFESGD